MLASLLLLSFTAPADAGTDVDDFTLSSVVEAIPSTDIDSGWWPESGPVRVRTVLKAEGFAEMTMDGDSILESNDGSTIHRIEPKEDTAEVLLDIALSASLHLNLDVAGYTYDDILAEESLDIDESHRFSSFAFADDGGEQFDFLVDTKELFEIDQGIIPLVEVVVSADITPTASVSYMTDSIVSDASEFTSNSQSEQTNGAEPTMLSALGQIDSELALEVNGHAEVCITFVGCYGDFNFDFPMNPIVHTQPIEFETVELQHSTVANSGGSNSMDGAQDSDDQSSETSGGCSTLAHQTNTTHAIVMLAALAGLILRRRKD